MPTEVNVTIQVKELYEVEFDGYVSRFYTLQEAREFAVKNGVDTITIDLNLVPEFEY